MFHILFGRECSTVTECLALLKENQQSESASSKTSRP